MGKINVPSAEYNKELSIGSATAAAKAAGATAVKDGLFRVPFKAIRPMEGFNVRVDTPDYLAHVETIKNSMRKSGFFVDKPVAVVPAKEEDGQVFDLTDGYTRYRALSELIFEGAEGFTDEYPVPCILKAAGQSMEDFTFDLITGNEGRPLTPFERAIVVARLVKMGVEEAKIAERLSITPRYVSDLLVLAAAPTKVRNLVIAGKVSATEAIKQLRKDAKGAGEKLEAGVKNAEASGKKKATAKDVDGKKDKPKSEGSGEGGEGESEGGVTSSVSVRNGKQTTTLVFKFKQGEVLPRENIMPVARFNDSDWWNYVDAKTKEHVVIEENITIEVKIISKVKEGEGEDGGTAEGTSEDPAQITDQSGDTSGADDFFDPAAGDGAGDGDSGL